MIKPDGVRLNLVQVITAELAKEGLVILEQQKILLSRKIARNLYQKHQKSEIFPALIDFITSAEVVILLIKGEDAVMKVRKIVGKKKPPSGLRGKFGKFVPFETLTPEILVQNIAHAPDSFEKARQELKILGWIKNNSVDGIERLFLIGGLSESGKSSTGKYLDSLGIKRMKFITFLQRIQSCMGDTGDFQEWNERMDREKPEWLAQKFLKEFKREIAYSRIRYYALESLYNADFGLAIKKGFPPDCVIIIFIDVPFKTRIFRQMKREHLLSYQQAEKLLFSRDDRKKRWGADQVMFSADIVLDNSGSEDDLRNKIDIMLCDYSVCIK